MKNLNIDKYLTYRYSFAKLKKAITNEFYFEAILIEYAIIEDRITSIFRRLGFLNKSENLPESNRKLLKRIFPEQILRWNDISIKIKVIQILLTVQPINLINHEDKEKLVQLSLKIKPFNDEITQILIKLSPWLSMRNKYVHSLMKYKTKNLENELSQFVLQGETIIKSLAQIVKKI
jgi:hypothetical protein